MKFLLFAFFTSLEHRNTLKIILVRLHENPGIYHKFMPNTTSQMCYVSAKSHISCLRCMQALLTRNIPIQNLVST